MPSLSPLDVEFFQGGGNLFADFDGMVAPQSLSVHGREERDGELAFAPSILTVSQAE